MSSAMLAKIKEGKSVSRKSSIGQEVAQNAISKHLDI